MKADLIYGGASRDDISKCYRDTQIFLIAKYSVQVFLFTLSIDTFFILRGCFGITQR